MIDKSSIFEKIYKDYLGQIAKLDFLSIEKELGVQVDGNEVVIPIFGKPHRVSKRGIADPSGKQPSFDICVILCKYLLLCPVCHPKNKDWLSYRDLKDSGPLTSYFANDVERAIAVYYTERVGDLKEASRKLGGYPPPDMELSYDLYVRFDFLPRIPILMLYNDADDEFSAKCSVLFERRAENYLDAECIAIAGRLLFTSLKRAGEKSLKI